MTTNELNRVVFGQYNDPNATRYGDMSFEGNVGSYTWFAYEGGINI